MNRKMRAGEVLHNAQTSTRVAEGEIFGRLWLSPDWSLHRLRRVCFFVVEWQVQGMN